MRWIVVGFGLVVLLLAFGYTPGTRGWAMDRTQGGMMQGGMMQGGMMQGGMMGHGETREVPQETDAAAGERLFKSLCVSCHPGGGNTITPRHPLRGAPQLADFNTFVAFLRAPRLPDGSRGPMPPFSADMITDTQAKSLYRYILDALNPSTRQ
jgi:mono/diheme cytochrome c family protein